MKTLHLFQSDLIRRLRPVRQCRRPGVGAGPAPTPASPRHLQVRQTACRQPHAWRGHTSMRPDRSVAPFALSVAEHEISPWAGGSPPGPQEELQGRGLGDSKPVCHARVTLMSPESDGLGVWPTVRPARSGAACVQCRCDLMRQGLRRGRSRKAADMPAGDSPCPSPEPHPPLPGEDARACTCHLL